MSAALPNDVLSTQHDELRQQSQRCHRQAQTRDDAPLKTSAAQRAARAGERHFPNVADDVDLGDAVSKRLAVVVGIDCFPDEVFVLRQLQQLHQWFQRTHVPSLPVAYEATVTECDFFSRGNQLSREVTTTNRAGAQVLLPEPAPARQRRPSPTISVGNLSRGERGFALRVPGAARAELTAEMAADRAARPLDRATGDNGEKPMKGSIPDDVYMLFDQFARGVAAAGFTRYSADAILHRIRWHQQIERGNRSFKCNDHWTSTLSRRFMNENPQYNGLFELRALATERSA